jgi:CheY-like chemotaxis protein
MLNVLYVEDDSASRRVLTMLQRINPDFMTLVMWENSEQFEQRLLALQPEPDLILLDIHVKPLTGFQMFRVIRSHRRYDSIPVVALTASVMNEEIAVLQETGFHGVLSKPLNFDMFTQIVERLILGEYIWYVW